MLRTVIFDDGNASHECHEVLTKVETPEEAKEVASALVDGWKDPDEEWYEVRVENYEGGLDLKPGVKAELI